VTPAAPAPGARLAPTRWFGLAAGVIVAAIALVGSPAQRKLQLAGFDIYQAVLPRTVQSQPAVIVAIDEKTLAEQGQWPWPRTTLARLIEAISAYAPAVIGVDLLLTEPDRLSPGAIALSLPASEVATRERLLALPSNDAVLAQAIARAPVVLGIAGMPQATAFSLRAPPFRMIGGELASPLNEFAGVLTSLDGIDRAARGRGLLSADLEGAVVRRMPLLASVAGTPTPGLALEMLRVATATPAIALSIENGAAAGVAVRGYAFPVGADGQAWIHFSKRESGRFVSAADVLSGRAERSRLEGKLVLIGISGLGLLDYQTAASGERMPGVEMHAQLLEMMFDNTPLLRPQWIAALEWLVFGAGSALMIWWVPAIAPRRALKLGVAVIGVPVLFGWALFMGARLLFDTATPSLNLALVFGVLLALSLIEANRREQLLAKEVQRQREDAARVAGELEAARRIQTGILPRPDALRADARIEIAAEMTPAREVGGDLYDFFPLDASRLFFLIGDVSGKGLPASIFMAVSKALYKSSALRSGAGGTDLALIGELMTVANAEVSRENGEAMFVTMFAGILDLDSGALAYCNAGHDNPYLLKADGGLTRLADGDGPPLCVIDDFEYHGGHTRLGPGDLLCMVTDGITEAMNRAQDLYGGERLLQVLKVAQGRDLGAGEMLAQVLHDVARFVAGADPADDLTLLLLRWNGPR